MCVDLVPLMEGALLTKLFIELLWKKQMEKQAHTGLTANRFKTRWYSHRSSFTNEDHQNHTTLSTHVWDLKQRDQNYEIKWSIVDRASDFNPTTRKCRLSTRGCHPQQKIRTLYNLQTQTKTHFGQH